MTHPNPYEPPSESKDAQELRPPRSERHFLLVLRTACAILVFVLAMISSIGELLSPYFSPGQRILRLVPIVPMLLVFSFVFVGVTILLDRKHTPPKV